MMPEPLSFVGHYKRSLVGLVGLLLLPACSESYLTDGQLEITTGQESEAWSADPLPKNVVLEMVETTKRTTLANVSAPVSSISLGTGGPENTAASFEATAFDEAANVVMKGATVPLQFGSSGFEDAFIPLFMGRLGGLSRPPGDLLFPHHHPQLLTLNHGYLLISGGDEASPNLDVYNFPRWLPGAQQKPLPKVPEAWAVAGSKILLIDHAGATWLDVSVTPYTESAVLPPVGLVFDRIIGGETIVGADDTQYIVGATRLTGEPTNQVLRVDPDATLHLMKLGTPRLGAAATMVSAQLLVVAGSATGDGAEVSTSDGTGFSSLPFPADARQGAAVVARDANTAVLAGGRDPATDEISGFRTMDLACSEDCAQVEIAKADFAFDYPRLFSLSAGQLLAVGEDPVSKETHVFTFDTGIGHGLNEFALRVPRTAASAFMSPNGQVGVIGGESIEDEIPATSLELFFPQP